MTLIQLSLILYPPPPPSLQIFLAIGIVEGSSNPSAFWNGKGDREAGNFHFDPTGFWNKKSQSEKNTLLLKELKNGRLAMMAMAAYTSEHWVPGSVPFLPGKF
jgi:Chlorophyll A-B binding protein